jgi:hypothetical protein
MDNPENIELILIAKKAFRELISNPENRYLESELGTTLDQLTLKLGPVSSEKLETGSWWTKKIDCTLHFEEKKVGRYSVWLNADAKVVDDSLSFF